jgi:hypothetical protein
MGAFVAVVQRSNSSPITGANSHREMPTGAECLTLQIMYLLPMVRGMALLVDNVHEVLLALNEAIFDMFSRHQRCPSMFTSHTCSKRFLNHVERMK